MFNLSQMKNIGIYLEQKIVVNKMTKKTIEMVSKTHESILQDNCG